MRGVQGEEVLGCNLVDGRLIRSRSCSHDEDIIVGVGTGFDAVSCASRVLIGVCPALVHVSLPEVLCEARRRQRIEVDEMLVLVVCCSHRFVSCCLSRRASALE